MRIELLADHANRFGEVAAFHFGEWPELEPGGSIEDREKLLAPCCRRNAIPLSVIALDAQMLCGFALLIEQDFELRPNLTPWMAGVFVRPQFRNRGVDSALVTRIENEAKSLSVETLYLYTAHSESLYARLGWQVLEHCDHNQRRYAVMARCL